MRANITEYMDIFVHVVESGSFIRAAEQLQMHRPAVSKALQQLEEELGVKLLHRTTRRLSLTSEGEAFYQRAKVLLGEMADLMATYSSTQSVSGSLRLDFPLTLAHSLLIPELGEFRERYPDIEIILTSSDRRIDLIAEGIDCVVLRRAGRFQLYCPAHWRGGDGDLCCAQLSRKVRRAANAGRSCAA